MAHALDESDLDESDLDDLEYNPDEVPCEFCGELFPFELIIEHSSGCYEQDVFLVHDNAQKEDVIEIDNSISIPDPIVSTATTTDVLTKIKQETEMLDTDLIGKILSIKEPDIQEPCLNFDELEKGIRLMEYARKSKAKVEDEQPSFRVPMPLLNNADQKEIENVCNSLSDDDDCVESLEDFWQRAERKISQRLNKRFEF